MTASAVSLLAQAIQNIDARLRILANSQVKLQAWTAPTLAGLWANVGAPYATAGYWKDPWGVVHLRGSVQNGAIPGVIFTLPAGYRPQAAQSFVVLTGAVVEARANGDIYITAGAAPVSLDGISVRAYA